MDFDVKQYGALGNGTAMDTGAVQSAIDACNANGGGRVVLQGGVFVCGTLFLRSFVELYVDASAKLLASGNSAHYAKNTHFNRYVNEAEMDPCFLYAEDAHDIALTGRGYVDGNAACFPNVGCAKRPMLVRFLRCSHVRMQDLHLVNPAGWTVACLDSEFLWATNLHLFNNQKYNGDCLDFDGCRHVYVQSCHMEGTDDNLCLQASSKAYPVEDIHIVNCSFTSLCAGVRIGLKSVGDIRNVVIANCTFHNVWREGVKIECTEGGSITDILLQNLVMRNVSRPLFFLLNNRLSDIGSSIGLDEMPAIGAMQRITVSGLTATDDAEMLGTHRRFGDDVMGSPMFSGIRVDAAETHPIQQLTLRDVIDTCIGGVKGEDIPRDYPVVVDLRQPHTGAVPENYYPDWSRATFLDIRSVQHLTIENMQLRALHSDTREPFFVEHCVATKKLDILVL